MVSSDEALKMMKAAKWEDAPNSLKILLKDIKNDILSKDKCTLSWHLAGKPQTLINRSKILNSLDEFKENVSKGYITGYTALGPHTWFNEWRYIFQLSVEKQYEICLVMSKWLGGGWELRGCFGIPPGGFLGWHTNANALMPRMYFVWNDSNTSQFYVDTDKGIKVIKESKGWRRNVFAPPAWHSGRTDGFRFSMGFRPSAMWTYMNKKDLKYLLKGTALLSDAPNGSCCKNNDCEAINDYKVGNKRYKVNMIDLEPLIDKKLLNKMKSNSLFILMSRAAVVNFNDLIKRVKKGDIFVATDVFPKEPVAKNNPIRKVKNILFSAHRAGALETAFYNMGNIVLKDMSLISKNLQPKFCKKAEFKTVGLLASKPVAIN